VAGEKILLIEDDAMIQDALGYSLQREGFEVMSAIDGLEGLRLALERAPDLVLLDLMLPAMGGLEVCREIRRRSTVPIVILSARGEETDRVIGLELGADDYVVKPFSTRELLARIRANLRRVGFAAPPEAAVGTLKIDLERRQVLRDGQPVHLSFREFELLKCLSRAGGAVVERRRLLDAVWGEDWIGDPRTLDVHIRWLREKLEEVPAEPQRILTCRNVGYRLANPEESP
jgi:DNA-binding response OmpR family regulator